MRFILLFAVIILWSCQGEKKNKQVQETTAEKADATNSLPLGLKTIADFEQNGKARSEESNDSLFLDFLKSFTFYQNNVNDHLYHDPKYLEFSALAYTPDDQVTQEALAFRDSVKQLGFIVAMSKGMMFLDKDPEFLARFSPYLSEGLNAFLTEFNKNIIQPFVEDKNILISSEEQARRMMFWENFDKEYPDFELKGYAQDKFQFHLFYFMLGSEDSPIHERDSMKIRKELLDAYNTVIREYPESIAAAYLKDYLVYLKKHNFTYDSSFEEYGIEKFPQFYGH